MKASGEIEASILDLPGLDFSSSLLRIEQTQTNNAIIEIRNTDTDNSGGMLKFKKISSSPAVSDVLGEIGFFGDDAGGTLVEFGRIKVK